VTGYSEIRYGLDPETGVALLTLDRPDARNALSLIEKRPARFQGR
jgi:enoyl-CoA hydratase/carnithine racemase